MVEVSEEFIRLVQLCRELYGEDTENLETSSVESELHRLILIHRLSKVERAADRTTVFVELFSCHSVSVHLD